MKDDICMPGMNYNYTQYSHDKHVNVIPREDFRALVSDTFKTITETLKATYGPYGSPVIIAEGNTTVTTKDGYNVFQALGFSHKYKRLIYLALRKIIERVNNNVGDGTTSCMLIADKIFNNLRDNINMPGEERALIEILNVIESKMVITEEDADVIKPLTYESFTKLINVADNYDQHLADILTKAIAPEFDENGVLINKRNVLVDSQINQSNVETTYSIDYLPGDYRVNVDTDNETIAMLKTQQSIMTILYDHAFSATDWNVLYDSLELVHSKDKILILARDVNRSFLDHEYLMYLRECRSFNVEPSVSFGIVRSDSYQDQIADLGALLNITPINLDTITAYDYSNIPEVEVSIYKNNILTFYNTTSPTEYIEKLQIDLDKDLTKSMSKRRVLLERINSLKLTQKDTMLTVIGSSSLANTLVCDKIDDCVSIVNSAALYGIVPNLLQFAVYKINKLTSNDEIVNKICNLISEAVTSLFETIVVSKYGSQLDVDKFKTLRDSVYFNTNDVLTHSFDIVTETFVDAYEIPTSAQYDMEVVAAAISIVKYLITSKAFVFDANILDPSSDLQSFQ